MKKEFSLLFDILSKSKRLTDTVTDKESGRDAYLVAQLFQTKIASVIVDRLLRREMNYNLCIRIRDGALSIGSNFFRMKEIGGVFEDTSLSLLGNVAVSETLSSTEIGEDSSEPEYKNLYFELLSLCMESDSEEECYFLSDEGYDRIDVEALRDNLFVSKNMDDALANIPDEIKTHFIHDLLFEVLDMEWVRCEACDFKFRIYSFTPLRDIPEAFDCLLAAMSTDDYCHGANYRAEDGKEYVSLPVGTYANLSQSYGTDAVYHYGDLLPCIAVPLYALAS